MNRETKYFLQDLDRVFEQLWENNDKIVNELLHEYPVTDIAKINISPENVEFVVVFSSGETVVITEDLPKVFKALNIEV